MIRKIERRGERVLFIDIRYTKKDVVQKMAGHRNLSTTQHYVHHLKADLEAAARLLDDSAGWGNSWATASAAP